NHTGYGHVGEAYLLNRTSQDLAAGGGAGRYMIQARLEASRPESAIGPGKKCGTSHHLAIHHHGHVAFLVNRDFHLRTVSARHHTRNTQWPLGSDADIEPAYFLPGPGFYHCRGLFPDSAGVEGLNKEALNHGPVRLQIVSVRPGFQANVILARRHSNMKFAGRVTNLGDPVAAAVERSRRSASTGGLDIDESLFDGPAVFVEHMA